MDKVHLVKGEKIGKLPATYSLIRTGKGPGRFEGHGFKSVFEAQQFAREWELEIIE